MFKERALAHSGSMAAACLLFAYILCSIKAGYKHTTSCLGLILQPMQRAFLQQHCSPAWHCGGRDTSMQNVLKGTSHWVCLMFCHSLLCPHTVPLLFMTLSLCVWVWAWVCVCVCVCVCVSYSVTVLQSTPDPVLLMYQHIHAGISTAAGFCV